MDERVIKPGKWFIVRIRRTEDGNEVVAHLKISNSSAAGPSGRSRRWHRSGRRRRFVARMWRVDYNRRRVYQFADLADARASARIGLIEDRLTRLRSRGSQSFVEILEVEGCLYYGTVVSERVVVRKLPSGLTGMQVLALESLGE